MNQGTSETTAGTGVNPVDNPITILIVDDHPMVREGLRTFLQYAQDMRIVGLCASGQEAVSMALREEPQVVLMDLVMPGDIDGVEATRQIISARPETRVIALTSYLEDSRILSILEAGAISFLQKDVNPNDLLDAIRQAATGRAILDAVAVAVLQRRLGASSNHREAPQSANQADGAQPLADPLTAREYDVLVALAQGLSNKEIASQLCISEKTVKVHIGHILAKLGVYDRTQALLAASRLGLIQL